MPRHAKPKNTNPGAALARLARDMSGMARAAMEHTCAQAEQEAKRTTAFKNYTGRLRASIAGGIQDVQPTAVIGVLTAGKKDAQPGRSGWETASEEYSVYVELGTSRRSPHAFIHPAMLDIGGKGLLGQDLRQRVERWRA